MQILWDHEAFQGYLHKTGKAPVGIYALCTTGPEDTPHYSLPTCMALTRIKEGHIAGEIRLYLRNGMRGFMPVKLRLN